MSARILTVFRKEIADALRDRRTTLMILVSSLVAGPLVLVLIVQFVAGMQERATTLKVRLAGAAHAPALVNFLQRSDVEIVTAPEDYAARVKNGSLDAVIVVPKDFHERWLAHEDARVDLVYDDSHADAAPAIRQAERLLGAFNRETAYLRLMARGVSPSLNESLKIERMNEATPRQRGAALLILIPMLGIFAPLLGGMTIAIDATAGERERGSLEPLLANPLSTTAFAVGKWLAAWASAALVTAVALGGFVLAAVLYVEKKLPELLHFGLPEYARFLVLVVPLAAMTSAVQMLISTYGRSYREAQTYVSYLSMVVTFIPAIVVFSGIRDAAWQSVVPFLGQLMALQRVLRGDALALQDVVVPAVVAIAVALGAIVAVARLLRDERIVFGRS